MSFNGLDLLKLNEIRQKKILWEEKVLEVWWQSRPCDWEAIVCRPDRELEYPIQVQVVLKNPVWLGRDRNITNLLQQATLSNKIPNIQSKIKWLSSFNRLIDWDGIKCDYQFQFATSDQKSACWTSSEAKSQCLDLLFHYSSTNINKQIHSIWRWMLWLSLHSIPKVIWFWRM